MPLNKSKVYRFSSIINSSLAKPGLLLACVGSDGKANVMSIAWGKIGILWNKPFFLIFVRKSRYTHELIEQTGDFTINVPPEGFKKVVDFCGTKSGRNVDKISKLGLKVKPSRKVKSPTLSDCLVTLECKVVFKKQILLKDIPVDVKERYYPKDNYHTCYFAEIVNITSKNPP